MPGLPSQKLESKVMRDNSVLLSEEERSKAKVPRQGECIRLNENTNNANGDVSFVLRRKKQEVNKNIASDEDVLPALQRRKQETIEENQIINVEKNVNNTNTYARKTEADGFCENTIIDIGKAEQNHNNDSADTNIIFITIESEVTQVGSRDIIILDEEDEALHSKRIQDTAATETSHAMGYFLTEIVAGTKKIPTENTDIESSRETRKHRENQDIHGDEKCRKSLEETTDGSDRNLHMSRVRKQRRRRRDGEGQVINNSIIRNDVMEKVHKNLGPASPSASYISLCKISDDVMFELQLVRDNGRWKVFDEKVVTLSCKYRTKEAKIVILLEKAMAACYQSRLEESEKMILKAIDMAKDEENSSVLIGRGFHYLSGVYRRQSLTGKAEQCVVKAEQNFHNKHLTLDSVFLAYERASFLMDFISKCPNPTGKIINDAKECLIKCITGCIALEGDADSQRYVKKHHFAFIKRAMLLLDCRTASGRKRTVSEQSIKEAEESLDTLKTRYWDGIAQGEKVQYFLGLADLYFRCEEYPKAEESAKEALDMAKRYGFKTEIKPAEDRIQEIIIKQKYNQEPCCHRYDDASDTGSQNGDVSSCESDFMETLSFP